MSLSLLKLFNSWKRKKGIPKEVLFEAVEAALVSAYKKNFLVLLQNVRVELNQQTGAIKVFSPKKKGCGKSGGILWRKISLRDALKLSPYLHHRRPGGSGSYPVRLLAALPAQAAKQVVIQKRIREAEREKIYEEFAQPGEREVVTGIIQSVSRTTSLWISGKVEAVFAAFGTIGRR